MKKMAKLTKKVKMTKIRFLVAVPVVCIIFFLALATASSADTELPTEGGDALNELMRALHGMRTFDSALYGLDGHFEIVGEVSGRLEKGGGVSRIRLIAIRREDGIFDRGLILEILPPEEDPFIIPLPEDVRGFHSAVAIKSFTSAEKSEILLTVDSGRRGDRFLIVDVSDRQGEIIFDSHNTNIPTITGRFLHNLRAEITVEETGETAMIDLSARRDEYNRRMVFHPSGSLRTGVRVWVDRFSLVEFIDTNNDGIFVIRKVVDLSGAGRADRIAYVDATLRFADGGWRVLDTWIAPAEDLSRMPMPIRIN